MFMNCNTTERMINSYIKQYFSNMSEEVPEEEKEFMQKEFKERTFQKIRQEIYDLEKERIYKEVHKEQKEENQKKQMKRLNFFILETLFIGVIVGLLVNQITDFISYTKGTNTINTTLTFRWVMVMLAILLLFVFLIYNSHLTEIFKNDKEE